MAQDPFLVIVLLGGNDALNNVAKQETISNIDRIVSRCTESGSMVILVHGKYGIFSDPYLKGFKRVEDIFGNPNRMYDQIHPNDAGYELIAQRVAGAVVPMLVEAASRQNAAL